MNLFETQDRLNSLPPSPQTLQYLSAAANGQNPNVPPWLALVRMTEIQKEMQAAQTMQQEAQGGQGKPPTVKDQVEQASGLMSLQNNRAQAGMQQLAQQAAQGQPPQGIPAALPQQPPQQAPQAQPQQAFRHGGMVRRFAGGMGVGGLEDITDLYLQRLRGDDERQARLEAQLEEQNRRRRELAAQPVPIPPNPEEEYQRQYKAFGIDPAQAYAEQQRRIEALQQRQQMDEAQRAQEREQMGRYGFANSLIQAGEATRGARGSGLAALLGGFGRAQGDLNTRMTDERRKSDAAMMERQSELNALFAAQNKARMGSAEGAAKRGVDYAGLQAEAQAIPQKRAFDTESKIGGETAQLLEAATRGGGNPLSGLTQLRTEASQAQARTFSTINQAIDDARGKIQLLTARAKEINADPRRSQEARAAAIAPLQQQITETENALKAWEARREALFAGSNSAGASSSPPPAGASSSPPPAGASGTPAPAGAPRPTGGKMPPPRTEAERWLQQWKR